MLTLNVKDCVQVLLEAGADIYAVDTYDHTPYFWAKGNGHDAIADLLEREETRQGILPGGRNGCVDRCVTVQNGCLYYAGCDHQQSCINTTCLSGDARGISPVPPSKRVHPSVHRRSKNGKRKEITFNTRESCNMCAIS